MDTATRSTSIGTPGRVAGVGPPPNGAGTAAAPDPARSAAYARIAGVRRRLLSGPVRETFDLTAALRS